MMFVDAFAADEAMRPGRAELDCVAVLHGFLPRGATLVSSPGVLDEFFEDDAEGLARARFVAAAAGYVTQNSDEFARRNLPGAAQRFDEMSREFKLARYR
ncbi:hypothetical protein [Sphingomonas sp. BK580]|uniref:hypothetical protein n=1 Tax=Sphingomonas sp. BK580 TaxID=2586972 RepID=UPI0016132395|nr:hypothetical protein [Sphingomonas sp. BK580]MBB3693614.1 hypothetical protein [Sphingomonas sp. BK580]